MVSRHPDRALPDLPSRRGVWLIPIAAIAVARIFTYWLTVPVQATDVSGAADWIANATGFTSGALYILTPGGAPARLDGSLSLSR